MVSSASEPSPDATMRAGIQAIYFADGLAQHRGAAFGIKLQIVAAPCQRLHRLGAWAQRAFVG